MRTIFLVQPGPPEDCHYFFNMRLSSLDYITNCHSHKHSWSYRLFTGLKASFCMPSNQCLCFYLASPLPVLPDSVRWHKVYQWQNAQALSDALFGNKSLLFLVYCLLCLYSSASQGHLKSECLCMQLSSQLDWVSAEPKAVSHLVSQIWVSTKWACS